MASQVTGSSVQVAPKFEDSDQIDQLERILSSIGQLHLESPMVASGSAPILSARLTHIKEKQADHLTKLEVMVSKGKYFWKHLQAHTVHENSKFDWWMFPINRQSQKYGPEFEVTKDEIELLKNDPIFMANYRKGVVLVAKSWGWDLERNLDVTSEEQFWSKYDVRIGKMLHSLQLFGEKELHKNLVGFVDKYKLSDHLESWILPYTVCLQ